MKEDQLKNSSFIDLSQEWKGCYGPVAASKSLVLSLTEPYSDYLVPETMLDNWRQLP